MSKLVYKLKKPFAIVLSAIMLLGIIAGCNQAEIIEGGDEYAPNKYVAKNDLGYIWCAPDTVSVMQDVEIGKQCDFWGKEWLDDADKFECVGMRGDTEAVQVMITAKKDVDSFNLTVGDLSLAGGSAIIDGSCVEILAERYIKVKNSSSKAKTANMFTGFYPDALVPINAYVKRKENKIAKNNNQGIWVNVHIPEDAEQGTYNGVMKLTLGDAVTDLPLTVKVYDVTMPSSIHAVTAFDIYYNKISLYENMDKQDEDGDIFDWNQAYFDFVLSKRLSPQATYFVKSVHLTSDYTIRVNECVELARNERITSYRLAFAGTTVEGVGEVVDETKLVGLLEAMARKNIELVLAGEDIDLFKKAYFYFNTIIDEPTPDKYDRVRYCDRAVTASKRTVSELFDDYIEGSYPDAVKNKMSAVKNSLLALPHLVTSPIDRIEGNEVDGGAQTWVCQTQHYKALDLKNVRTRQQSTEKYSCGEGFWSYMTMDSNNPVPSLQLEENLLSPRALFWINYHYNISGILYWCVNYYSRTGENGKEVSRDVWTDPNTYLRANGDGYLLYPGSKYGLTTPISTLRLESLRQGSEDYEYIYMLEKAIADYNGKHGTSYDFSKVMTRFYADVFVEGSMVCKTNVKKFMTARNELLTLLEAVVNDADNAASLLAGYEAYSAG